MDFITAAELKHIIMKKYSVVLHIYDTCGGLYLSIDEPNEAVKKYIIDYCRKLGTGVTVSEDGRSFFPGGKKEAGDAETDDIEIHFEQVEHRATAYRGSKSIGFCSYVEKEGRWVIDHTWVEPRYRSQGVADRLVEAVVEEARKRQIKLDTICSYAKEWIRQHRG